MREGVGGVMETPIEFSAELVRVATLSDGGVRATIDLPESEIAAAVLLLAMVVKKPLVHVRVEPQGD